MRSNFLKQGRWEPYSSTAFCKFEDAGESFADLIQVGLGMVGLVLHV